MTFPSFKAGLTQVAWLLCLFLSLFQAVGAAELARKAFDIAAGPAPAALKQFISQSGVPLLYAPAEVAEVRTNAVKGEFTPAEAADLLVSGTDLSVIKSANGALTINRAARPNALGAAPEVDRPDNAVENGMVKLQEVEVTGSRIRTLLGEQTAQPVVTMDRRQIERTGVTNVGDLFRYIPQITASSNGDPTANGLGSVSLLNSQVTMTASLHGFENAATLILVNGRRVNKTGQSTAFSHYDLFGVSVASIDRVEVLLDGASAIYGADAVAGVINIVTKPNYNGTELALSYDNTFDTDSATRTASLTHGFARGPWSGTLSFTYQDNTSISRSERRNFASSDRRSVGGTDQRSTVLVEGTGYVRSATVGVPLPGLTTDRAAIPANSTGRNLTVADFANAGPIGAPYDPAAHSVYPTTEKRFASANLEYRFRPWLSVFTEIRLMEAKSWGSSGGYTSSNLTLPATAPGNPFGVPIVLSKVFFDEEVVTSVTRFDGSALLGMRGDIFRDWRYELSVSDQWSRAQDQGGGVQVGMSGALVTAAMNSASPPVLLYDSTRVASPNASGTLARLVSALAYNTEVPATWTYSAQADGPLWKLPGGVVRAAVGYEFREEYADFPAEGTVPRNPLLGTLNGVRRTSSAEFVELRIPIVSEKQNWATIDRLEATAAVRRDEYSDSGSSISPTYRLMYRPTKWMMLRSSLSRGFRAPDLFFRYRPLTMNNITTTNANSTDPLRNNAPVQPPYIQNMYGNPDLKPEHSTSKTTGVVVDVPFLKGLSFSADVWQTSYVDRIVGTLTAYTFPQAVVSVPGFVVRGPNLPGDAPGIPGPITHYNSTYLNLSTAELGGYDVGVKYSRTTRWGEVLARVDASKTTRNELRVRPELPQSTASGTSFLPFQATGSLFWTLGPLDTGALFAYRGAFRQPSAATPKYGSAIRWDWQASYSFDRVHWARFRQGLAGKALRDLRLSASVYNVLNTEPPQTGLGAFDLSTIDFRQQHYVLQLTKKF